MVSAFLNTVKIPELRRRILFTLAVIVIVRLGAAITTPGVNPAVLQEWFRSDSRKTGGGVAALFNLFSGGALENCAIFSLGIMPYISASIMLQLLTAVIPQLGRLAREDGGRQKIMQYTRYATVVLCIFQGYLLAVSFQHPESYHTMLPGNYGYDARLGIPLVDDPGLDLSDHHGPLADHRHTFPDVAGRSNHRARHRQRYFVDHHDRDRGAPARSAGAGVENVCAVGATGTSQVNPAILVLMVAFLVHRDRSGHRRHARRPQNYGAIRQARGRPKNVRRANAIHAVEGELRGRDADHFRLGVAPVSHHDRRLVSSRTVRWRNESRTRWLQVGRTTWYSQR